jgi:DNA-binding ferritin-like protein
MKRFSEFKFQKKLNEQEVSLPQGETSKTEITDQQEQKEDKNPVGDFAKLVSTLFESRQKAHVYHLQLRGDEGSHAAHLALDSYYSGILDFIDELVEVYQGQYGIIEKYDEINTDNTTSVDKLVYFEELVKSVREQRKIISVEDTHLQNIADEIIALMYKTIYKLKFNK